MAGQEASVVGGWSAVAMAGMTRGGWTGAGTGGDHGAPGTKGGLHRSDVA